MHGHMNVKFKNVKHGFANSDPKSNFIYYVLYIITKVFSLMITY